jgi:hypothetical protein
MIFVSHRESEQQIAMLLVEFLLAAIDIDDDAIRCTSVPGHQLPFGETIGSRLKADIHASSGVYTILTPESLTSKWVLFELGASWGLGKMVVPILGQGLRPADLPGPLSAYPCVQIDASDAAARLLDSTSQLAKQLGLHQKAGGKAQESPREGV